MSDTLEEEKLKLEIKKLELEIEVLTDDLARRRTRHI